MLGPTTMNSHWPKKLVWFAGFGLLAKGRTNSPVLSLLPLPGNNLIMNTPSSRTDLMSCASGHLSLLHHIPHACVIEPTRFGFWDCSFQLGELQFSEQVFLESMLSHEPDASWGTKLQGYVSQLHHIWIRLGTTQKKTAGLLRSQIVIGAACI